jgi:hypothetical protein
MSHFSGINQEVHNYMTQDVPHSLKSNSSAQAIKTRNRIFQVSSTSQSQSSGGVVLFNIPPSNYSITKGTMALRARITATGTGFVAATNAVATNVGFQGPAGNLSLTVSTSPQFGNGYAPISRITVYGANSAVIEQQNYANDNMNLLLLHNSNASYLAGDAQILAGVGTPFTATSTTSAFIDVVLPLPLSAFNSSTQDFPNYLLSAPLTMQLDLASVARSIWHGATATVSEYTISSTYLVYQACELPAAYVEAERMAVKSSPFIMNLTSTLNVQVPASILSSYSLGLNASSVRAVFVLPSNYASAPPATSTTSLSYWRDTVDSASNYNGAGTNAICFVDGNQINSAIYDNPAMVFQGMKNALHHSLQGSIIYSSPALGGALLYSGGGGLGSVNPWISQFYAIGFDLTSFDDEASLFAGSPCTTLNLQLTGYGSAQPTYLSTIIVVYDVLLAFEADGTIQVKR